MTIRQGNKIIAGNINVEDYNTLQNKPQINSVELSGNKTLEELGIQASGDYALKSTTLAGYGITDGLSTSQITNCITKIPQDIKLELSEDGTLTLKAGSKVYVPNGAGIFDEVVIQNDISRNTIGSGSGQFQIYYTASTNALNYGFPGNTSSGTTPPTSGLFYKIDTNSIDYYNNNTITISKYSFPLCTITASNGKIISLDQVFNGFGFMGNILFALPNVEGLAPNGRNADGSLNNIKSVTSKVVLHNSHTSINNWPIILKNDSSMYPLSDYLEADTYPYQPATGKWYSYYSKKDNKIYQSDNGSVWVQSYGYIMGKLSTDTSFKITSFSPKNIFQAVDRNDTEWASTASKPSDRYVDLTLQASGTQYTAPANGWFLLNKSIVQAEVGEYINIWVNDILWAKVNSPISHQTCLSVSVKKGDVCRIDYSASGETNTFKFCYDEGVKQ